MNLSFRNSSCVLLSLDISSLRIRRCTDIRLKGVGSHSGGNGDYEASFAFYREAMQLLQQQHVPFLVGGAYAFCHYTGIARHTKDFDIFLRPHDIERALSVFREAGMRTERPFRHWLAKAWRSDDFVDLIYRAGNGMCEVDDTWFERAPQVELLGLNVGVCAAEDIIWMKAFIMERERFDGADIAHFIQSCAEKIDWQYLVRRFGPDWRVLLSHLLLFGYIYPGERNRVPPSVLRDLLERAAEELATNADHERVCRGTLLSRAQYLPDVNERGYRDARLDGRSHMTREDIAHWTSAIDEHVLPGDVQ